MAPVRIEMDTHGSVLAGRWMGGGMLATASILLVIAAFNLVTKFGEPSRWGGAAVVAGLALLLVWHGRSFWALRRRAHAHLQLSDDGLTIVDQSCFDQPVFVAAHAVDRVEMVRHEPSASLFARNVRAGRLSGWTHPDTPLVGNAFTLPPTTLLVFREALDFPEARSSAVMGRGNPYPRLRPRRSQSAVLLRLVAPEAAHWAIEAWLQGRSTPPHPAP